jgi:3-deoxy-7-phosphoheptulonate synthase/3,4-dideoxy-4-amino-D-arabino-heptulosonate 7-phosphate synthase
MAELAKRPPLVEPDSIRRLQERLAEVAGGRAFILQAGSCAELFDTPLGALQGLVKVILQMTLILTLGARVEIVKIIRGAGQYGKPRSKDTDANGLPSYRGDIVNGREDSGEARRHDPGRLLRAYDAAKATLANLARLAGGGTGLFSSHEGLVLDYEAPQLREGYATSGHFIWIGERTRHLLEAHVEFFRHVLNPVGVKIGPTTTPEEIQAYCRILNPLNTAGKLVFIARMGAGNIRHVLPGLIAAAEAIGCPVVWICDPMHGNTITVDGHKTRRMADLKAEIAAFFEICPRPGGIHLEITGDDVTECLDGPEGIQPGDLDRRYTTACDPRLNGRQSLEIALFVAQQIARHVPALAAA